MLDCGHLDPMQIAVIDAALSRYFAAVEKASSGEPQWRRLQRIASKVEPDVRRTFLRAVSQVQDGTAIAAVAAKVAEGDLDGAMEIIPWKALGEPVLYDQLVEHLRDAFVEAATVTAARDFGDDFTLDVIDPRAVEYMAARGAERIVEISKETEAGLRTTLTDAYDRGLNSQEIARLVKPQIGLNERLATAVANYHANLLEQDYAPGKAATEAGKYAERLRQYRAMMIARTEPAIAIQAGVRGAWDAAADDGLFERETAKRRWVASPNCCDVCEELDGVEIDYDDEYPGGAEPGSVHPACSCTEEAVIE